jgi:hypothetical protein
MNVVVKQVEKPQNSQPGSVDIVTDMQKLRLKKDADINLSTTSD